MPMMKVERYQQVSESHRRFKKTLAILLLLAVTASGAYFFFSDSSVKPIQPSENISATAPSVDTEVTSREDSVSSTEPTAQDGNTNKNDRVPRISNSTTAEDAKSEKSKPTRQKRATEAVGSQRMSMPRVVATEELALSGTKAPAQVVSTNKSPEEKAESITVQEPGPFTASSPPTDPQAKTAVEFWLWLGSGMNFQYYKQTLPNIEGEATFQNIQGPTALIRAGAQGEKYGLDVSYKETPGKMETSETITVTNGNYNWRTVSGEGLYRLNDHWNLRSGLQYHLMPFMALNATTATLDVKSNTLAMFTLGFDRSFLLSDRLRGEWQMRYQHPLLSGSTDGTPFEITPKFAFDGSIGGVYSLTKIVRLGLYWYGQWHEYNFKYGRGADQFVGNQTLFYSNVEIRFGLEF